MPINSITRYPGIATGGFNQPSPATSSTLTIASGDLVIVLFVGRDDAAPGTLSISNSGTALSWTQFASVGNLRAWAATAAETENRTVSVAWTSGNMSWTIEPIVLKGQHATDAIPSGNIYTSSGGATNDVSRTFTPTAGSKSAYFGILQDMSDTNSFVAGANCELPASSVQSTSHFNSAIVVPTTNPRTDSNDFTLAASDSASANNVHYIFFEVRAADAASGNAPRAQHYARLRNS